MLSATLLLAAVPAFAAPEAQGPTSRPVDLTLQPGAALTGRGVYGRTSILCDDFDRPDGPMTGDWMQMFGQQEIRNDRGYAGANAGNQWMESTTADCVWNQSETSINFPPNNGGTDRYLAIVTGSGGTNNFYTKIQSQGSSMYNFIGFYKGFNAGGWSGTGTGFRAITPVAEGRMIVLFDNQTNEIILRIDEFDDGFVDYGYRAGNASSVGNATGNGHGIGTFGEQEYDDWNLNEGCNQPLSLSVTGSCPGSLTFEVDHGTDDYVLVYGSPGTFTAAGGVCVGATVDIASPTVGALFTTPTLTLSVPAAGCGLTVQVVDFGTCEVSNEVVL